MIIILKKNILYFNLIFFLFLSNITLSSQTNTKNIIKRGLVDDLEKLGLHTGDLAFFQNKEFYGQLTQIGTLSPFTHSAMIVIDENNNILLTHATNNYYDGFVIPVIGEKKPRSGVILTRLDDLFLSTDNKISGFYKRIWIRKLKDSLITHPSAKAVLKLYKKYKDYPFETSSLNFILSTFDLYIDGKDVLSFAKDKKLMCSEYISYLFKELSFPIHLKELPRETTPVDIYTQINDFYDPPVIYEFENGKYHIVSNY